MEYKIDFGTDKNGERWNVINDGVMGGLSQGQVKYTDNSMLFKGSVSLENNGGFSSFKGPFTPTDLSGFETVTLRLRSKGISTALTLEMNRRFYMPYYKHDIETNSEDWETITINLSDFKAYRMGREMGMKLDSGDKERIIRIGFITNEKREGPFELEVDYIEFK